MYDPVVILLDVAIFFLAITCCYIAVFKLRLISKGMGWWWLLALVFLWTSFVRFLYILVATDVIPRELSPYITASQIVFYVGITFFFWELYKETVRLRAIEDELL